MPTHLVTGATDGIGVPTTQQLARHGARILVHGRSRARAEAAARALGEAVPGCEAVAVWGDLARFAEVRALAEQVRAAAPTLDVLVNNAGVFMNERVLTDDGHEQTFQVNHLAPFLLTLLLRPAVLAAPQGRVVNVSSVAHNRARLDLDDVDSARRFTGYGAYAMSKLCNVLFTHALARRLEGTRATTSALHPGVLSTKLLKEGFGMRGAPVESGARTTVYCATAPELAAVSGRYYQDAEETSPAPHASDVAVEEKLWALSEALVGERWPAPQAQNE